eukprot:TRINITY_DN90842_c0_g1_i2.p2 TRINITY_DN90842_c0_g1~~TRINITY_DN90842_c0_g1_i2.p2  ORF type:complete len:311 (+),score=30.43 TRINITY_DN90842_c0_g1_i2:150-1082(+)
MQQRTICLSQPRKILLTQVLVRQAWQLRNRTIVQYKAPRSQYGGEKEYEDDPELYDKIWDPGQNLENSDWREFRARLVQLEHGWKQSPDEQDPHQQVISDNVNSLLQTIDHDKSVWAHLISRPEQGSLLVSRSDDLGFFNYTAILLLKHDDRVGTIGLVLNKPSPLTVRDVFTRSDVANAFGSQNVYFGGPVGYDRLNVLHSKQIINGVQEIVRGLYIGGIDEACAMVDAGIANSKDFRLMFGYCGWDPWQLAAELHDDSWYNVSASREVILRLIFGDFKKCDKSDCYGGLAAYKYLIDMIDLQNSNETA